MTMLGDLIKAGFTVGQAMRIMIAVSAALLAPREGR